MIQRTKNVRLGGIPSLIQNKSQKLHGGGHRLGTEGRRTLRVNGWILGNVSGLGRRTSRHQLLSKVRKLCSLQTGKLPLRW